MTMTSALVTDTRSLDRLKERATQDPKAAIQEAAKQFEALFMQAVVKSMRDSLPKGGIDGGSQSEIYVSMYDQQLAQTMSGRPGGLAESIARQLSGGSRSAVVPGAVVPGAVTSSGASRTSWSPSAQSAYALPSTGASAGSQSANGLTESQTQFVEKLWQPALAAQRETGVPAAFIVGQAALETGWGKYEIRKPDGSAGHNLFGIKANANWRGESSAAVTTEYVAGKAAKVTENFRTYANYADSLRDWAQLMVRSPRYSAVVRDGQTVAGFTQGLQKAGYATDPDYAAKLSKVINQTLTLKRSVKVADMPGKAGTTG
jgi:peptidoglycan hydrolase FlgJ